MSHFTPERGCADCHVENVVMVAMKPGVDGREWFLCVRCHVRSTRPEPTATLDAVRAASPRRERQGQH